MVYGAVNILFHFEYLIRRKNSLDGAALSTNTLNPKMIGGQKVKKSCQNPSLFVRSLSDQNAHAC